MQIQVNSPHIKVSSEFQEFLEERTTSYLERYADWLTRVEIHLREDSKARDGNDASCVVEARIRSMDPVAAEAEGEDTRRAFTVALEKLRRLLSNKLGRRTEDRHV